MDDVLIRVEDVYFAYRADEPDAVPALNGISLTIRRGEYVAIVGHNGSGKSTLARHLNALLLPTRGKVYVQGMDTTDPRHTLAIRRIVGMVFQDPDNQIVGTLVEEDVAFGPENLGVPRPALVQRVEKALQAVRLWELRHRPPHLLSGGQRQRVAIAGVLAMEPACLVLDEATSMLDPASRAEVLQVVGRLHAAGTTIIAITHFMEEAALAERIIVLAGGKIALEGTPQEVFSQRERLRELRLVPPTPARLAEAVHARSGVAFVPLPLTRTALVQAVHAHAVHVPAGGRL